jgi:hypothetical protein
MGFSSYLTADTKESIANVFSGHPNSKKTVYLLQPNQASISESAYQGYCNFGGTNSHIWLCEANVPAIKDLDEEIKRYIGVALECGSYYIDEINGKKWQFGSCLEHIDKSVCTFQGNYQTPQPEYDDLTPNELIKSGRWQQHDAKELLPKGLCFPLKFSYDPNADYNALPASKNCPNQGYFY